MCNRYLKLGLLIAALGMSQPSSAGNSLLAGYFLGSEPVTGVVWPGYRPRRQHATLQIRFSVSSSGSYRLEDLYDHWTFSLQGKPGLNLITALYQGSFDPQNPALNRLGRDEYAAWPRQLEAGTEYTLVLQNVSAPMGVWTVVINGPGEVNSTARVHVPGLGQGSITGTEAKVKDLCSEVEAGYKVEGPFKVSRDGVHYFTNMSHLSTASEVIWDSEICFGVYSTPPDPQHPEAGRLEYLDRYRGSFELQADTDYYLLVGSVEDKATDYFMVIAPPAPAVINPWMSGLWADPGTDGQGVMLNVYPSIDAVHLAWFTYDLERPGTQTTAQLGEPGHRWLTAFGGLNGPDSDMTITRTAGGVFDATQPVPQQIQDGSIQLNFSSCTEGTLAYDLGSANTVGQLILKRPFEDAANIDRCNLENAGPGIPGPL